MTPHSPGPWQAEAPPAEAYLDPDIALSEEVRFWIVDEGRGSEVLAEVTLTMRGNEEANARLMASAPDLLRAVDVALGYVVATGNLQEGTEASSLQKLLRAAIAKATGQ
jgi:hypothetical protein